MTPQEHIAKAEQTLTIAEDAEFDDTPTALIAELLFSVAHSLIAIAVESGVPHAPAQLEGS